MKVEVYDSFTVEASGNFISDTTDFGIKNPAFIFEAMCTKLYQRALQTMIQEYMCNARDAHREAGKHNVPITVVLPTRIDPYISIIDQGIGLSPERIKDTFVFLGESTKRENNSQTGGFGIGAKVGWAYGDSFSIISIFNNISTTYLAYIGDKGVGKLTQMSQTETKSPNGVTIRIKIKDEDFYDTEEAVNRMCRFFDFEPIVKNRNHPQKYEYCGVKNPVYFVHNERLYDSGICLLIDSVPYPIEGSDLNLPFHVSTSSKFTYVVPFNTGELNVAVNRESIRYDKETLSVIQKRFDGITEKIREYFTHTSTVGNLGSLFECAKNLQSKYPGVLLPKFTLLNDRLIFSSSNSLMVTAFNLSIFLKDQTVKEGEHFESLFVCERAVELKSEIRLKRIRKESNSRVINSLVNGTSKNINADAYDMNLYTVSDDMILEQIYVYHGTSVSKPKVNTVLQKLYDIYHIFVNIIVVRTADEVFYEELKSIGVNDLNSVKDTAIAEKIVYTSDSVRKLFSSDKRRKYPIETLITSAEGSPIFYCLYNEKDKHASKMKNGLGSQGSPIFRINRTSSFVSVNGAEDIKALVIVITQDQQKWLNTYFPEILHVSNFQQQMLQSLRNIIYGKGISFSFVNFDPSIFREFVQKCKVLTEHNHHPDIHEFLSFLEYMRSKFPFLVEHLSKSEKYVYSDAWKSLPSYEAVKRFHSSVFSGENKARAYRSLTYMHKMQLQFVDELRRRKKAIISKYPLIGELSPNNMDEVVYYMKGKDLHNKKGA